MKMVMTRQKSFRPRTDFRGYYPHELGAMRDGTSSPQRVRNDAGWRVREARGGRRDAAYTR